jgi:hypothetical protein
VRKQAIGLKRLVENSTSDSLENYAVSKAFLMSWNTAAVNIIVEI